MADEISGRNKIKLNYIESDFGRDEEKIPQRIKTPRNYPIYYVTFTKVSDRLVVRKCHRSESVDRDATDLGLGGDRPHAGEERSL